jgi:hypothetical protein
MTQEAQWIELKCQRVLYVSHGRTVVVCDRDLPTHLLVLVELPALSAHSDEKGKP